VQRVQQRVKGANTVGKRLETAFSSVFTQKGVDIRFAALIG
jgi:hypothetical protein